MTSDSGPGRGRVAAIVAAVVAVAGLRVLLASWGPQTATLGLALDALGAVAAAVASWSVWRRPRDRRSRRAWALLVAFPLAWLLAPVIWLLGLPDVVGSLGRAAAVMLVGCSWWFAARASGTLSRVRLAIDGVIGAAALVVVFWSGPLADAWRAAGGGPDGVAAVGLPLAMAGVTIFGAGITVTEMQAGRRARPGLFVLASLLLAVSDLAWSVGAPPVWAAGWAAYALTVRTQTGLTPRLTRTPTHGREVWLPYALIVPAAVALVLRLQSVGVTPVHVAAASAVVVLLIARQHLTLVENGRLVTRLEATERRLHHLATHDALTGLPGRAALSERLTAVAALQGEHRRHVVLAFVDIDRFKEVNDVHGHATGDAVLVEVASRLTHVPELGGEVFAARLGGDEFAVLHVADGVVDAPGLAAALTEAVSGPLPAGPVPVSVGASVGLAVVDGDTFDPSDLLHRADLAMYAVKRAGAQAVLPEHPAADPPAT